MKGFMDSDTWAQMTKRLKDRGLIDYTDGDIVAEYQDYCKAKEAAKAEITWLAHQVKDRLEKQRTDLELTRLKKEETMKNWKTPPKP